MEEMKRRLIFAVNGERFELQSIDDPSKTLLEFLRSETPYKGPKLGCGEGGCGACVVLLARYDPATDQVEEHTVSSCLTLLCSINLCSVTTSEGLGNSKDGFHSIHQRFAGFHASQCGFCTPGMCISIFSALTNADKSKKSNAPTGFSKLTVSEAEKAIAGNLCRCTGYQPIVDACKSFVVDVDMEDLGFNSFCRKGENGITSIKKLPVYNPTSVCTFPEFLKDEVRSNLDLSSKCSNDVVAPQLDAAFKTHLPCSHDNCWYLPTSIKELYNLLSSEEANGSRVRLVVGNTGVGIYRNYDQYDKYIDVRNIPELLEIKRDDTKIEIGAAVTISRTIEALKEGKRSLIYTKIGEHMSKVASHFIRNMASLGGNLILAQRNHFASDIATILLGAGTYVCVTDGLQIQWLSLEDFLEMPPFDSHTLLVKVSILSWEPNVNGSVDAISERRLLYETYRAAPRPLGNAVAYINAAFLVEVCTDKKQKGVVLDNPRLAFGAYGTEHAIRATKVENFLVGKSLTASVLLEAIRILRATIVPEEGTPHSDYKLSVAVAFLFDFLRPLTIDLEEANVAGNGLLNGGLNGYNKGLCDEVFKTEQLEQFDHLERSGSLLPAKQVVEFNGDHCPVGEPVKKVGAELQASGEAVFVDDIPSPKDCLYGAFIYSTKPSAHVKGIHLNSTIGSQKFITLISFKDIPKGGENIGANFFSSEPIFAEDNTENAGQPLGLVIAESQRVASMAANRAVIDYSTENMEPPNFTVEDAVRRSSYFQTPSFFSPKPVGHFSKGMEEADHKILSAEITLGSQYYFYMETQTALAVPDEDNCMVVYSSNQNPEIIHSVIARCLGIPGNNVRVITRRVGGGFRGKAIKAVVVATARALAAHKLRRPVRMYLDRKTDMIMVGGRHPMKVTYSVGFKSDGKITALNVDILINAGINEDVSPLLPKAIIGALQKYNWGTLSFDVRICKTNLTSKSAMRAPGDVQGSYIAEAVIEHVASTLSMDTHSVRKKNLHTHESLQLFYKDSSGEPHEYTLPAILEKLANTSSLNHRSEMIKQFNMRNKWRKRGISSVPIVFEVSLRPTPGRVGILNDGSVVVEVGGIEIGQGLWTKVKQMTAFGLGKLWSDGSIDLIERVRVVQSDTLSLIQGGYTAGSTTSEASCEAVRLACNILFERLAPLKERLQEQMGEVSWDALILQASLQTVNLSASTYWVPDSSSRSYLNYGAATSEVEVDLLTGAIKIMRTDLIYDCGKSLNPAVDLGQIEGGFVQGIGFFMLEECLTNSDGLVVSDSTWTYKIPTIDTIPKQFNVEILNSGHHEKRVLSSKASGEPPLLLAVSIHSATREAIRDARRELATHGGDFKVSPTVFQLPVPATMPVIKELCGLKNVESYLESLIAHH